jgi:hypothetical protein
MIVPETEAQRELAPGENLLWADRPDPSQQGSQYLPVVLFGTVWTAFSLFWIWGASEPMRTHAQVVSPSFDLFPLFGLPFVLIGIGMLTSPYWAAQKAKSTVYAITDRRILIIQCVKNRTVRSIQPADIGELQRTEKADGSGTLIFGKNTYQSQGNSSQSPSLTDRFVGVRNIRMVEDLIRDNLKR